MKNYSYLGTKYLFTQYQCLNNKFKQTIFRSNQTVRPSVLDIDADLHKTVIDTAENINPWNIFLELLPPDSGQTVLPNFDKETDVLLFFKMYDPKQKKIHYCGHSYLPVTSKLSDIIPLLNDRAGFPPDTELLLYEEIRPNMIEKITNFNDPLEKVSKNIYKLHTYKLYLFTILYIY